MSDILIYPDPKFNLLKMDREKLIHQIQTALQGRVDSAWLFGSFATGKVHAHSDIDIILVKETSVSFVERGKEFLDLTDIFPAMDIIVYTPEEFQRKQADPSFQKTIGKQLKKIV